VDLRPISKASIPRALEKAERYRLLNEPRFAESICLDILAVEPKHQPALITLLLALTDQFALGEHGTIRRAEEALVQLEGDYERAYYAGIICERRAKAHLDRGATGAAFVAYEYLSDAMAWYEKADALGHPDNDDPVLRRNTCVRLIARYRLQPAPEGEGELPLE
jgi:hypothetical protein